MECNCEEECVFCSAPEHRVTLRLRQIPFMNDNWYYTCDADARLHLGVDAERN